MERSNQEHAGVMIATSIFTCSSQSIIDMLHHHALLLPHVLWSASLRNQSCIELRMTNIDVWGEIHPSIRVSTYTQYISPCRPTFTSFCYSPCTQYLSQCRQVFSVAMMRPQSTATFSMALSSRKRSPSVVQMFTSPYAPSWASLRWPSWD